MYLFKDFHNAMARIQQNFLLPKINTKIQIYMGLKVRQYRTIYHLMKYINLHIVRLFNSKRYSLDPC